MLETDMSSKNILVTGATSGIGEEIAKWLHSQGATVILIGRNQKRLEELEKELVQRVYSIRFDLTDLEHIENIFEECRKKELKLHGLVHSAGIAVNGVIKSNDIRTMEETMAINCFSFFQLGKYFSLKKYSYDNSSIVAISSVIAWKNDKGLSQYAASKAALNSAVKVMSKEFLRRKIRVNAILPANVLTPMFEKGKEIIEGFMEHGLEVQPYGFIEPVQIAYLTEFLLSDKAAFMTGALVPISGGMEF